MKPRSLKTSQSKKLRVIIWANFGFARSWSLPERIRKILGDESSSSSSLSNDSTSLWADLRWQKRPFLRSNQSVNLYNIEYVCHWGLGSLWQIEYEWHGCGSLRAKSHHWIVYHIPYKTTMPGRGSVFACGLMTRLHHSRSSSLVLLTCHCCRRMFVRFRVSFSISLTWEVRPTNCITPT